MTVTSNYLIPNSRAIISHKMDLDCEKKKKNWPLIIPVKPLATKGPSTIVEQESINYLWKCYQFTPKLKYINRVSQAPQQICPPSFVTTNQKYHFHIPNLSCCHKLISATFPNSLCYTKYGTTREMPRIGTHVKA